MATDPRRDTPAMLRERLRAELAGADESTIRGWLRAAAAALATSADGRPATEVGRCRASGDAAPAGVTEPEGP